MGRRMMMMMIIIIITTMSGSMGEGNQCPSQPPSYGPPVVPPISECARPPVKK